ncbi:uncharacterized protein K02A2.6-like [Pectinophora gossypiella]|uniref:uncharacterized protein K02A2.6-like n=1 Tax=Pectinophora gossypiella TaxID=13191 RepID=UPI00214E4C55|nr:uncharacterized protein K02A2.6-like [Pectinophora gossypiella]
MMRSRIFAEKSIRYKEAVELALALEAAEKHAEVSGTTGASVAVTDSTMAVGDSLHYGRIQSGGRSTGHGPSAGRSGGGGASGAGRAGQAAAEQRACWRCGKPHPSDRCRGGRQNYVSEESEDDMFNIKVAAQDYGTPIVPVVKQNGEIRICGDYKVTINPKLKRDYYPLPRIDELFANLSGGEKFSKIDLRHAYEQCLLTSDSQRYTAITTHMGTFAYRRTPYGLSCVPEKFQKIMEETLRGVGCVVFLDDICVTGSNKNEHIKNLRAVLERLRDMGLTVKLSKCSFLQDSVKYLGFIINKEGLRPDPSKLDAISNAPRPENVTQLKSFLGMLNYYGRFIPNLSTMLHPLHALLKKGVDWKWNVDCEKSFEEAKRCLLSERVLAHYEEGRELVLSVDSSAYGLGAVLAHRYAEGERPISCVSRTLNAAERGYSQLDKEALAIIFGVTKHHQYLFGRRFTLRTDHQPLVHIFGDKGGIPQTAASRLQRWAARLAAYDFKIEFVRSVDNGPADALSRLPLARETRCADTLDYLNLVKESLPISCKEIARATEEDAILSKIKGYVIYVYWPNLDSDIETLCRACDACRAVRDAPPRAQLHAWEFPLHPWQRVHADFADCAGVRYFILVDAHSKWIEVVPMRGTDAGATTGVLRHIFARFGPQGNGAAENAVKTVKKAIKRALHTGEDVNTALGKFLLQYRNCNHATTGVSPAVALQGRRLRSRLDALRPDRAAHVRAQQERQAARAGGSPRSFTV